MLQFFILAPLPCSCPQSMPLIVVFLSLQYVRRAVVVLGKSFLSSASCMRWLLHLGVYSSWRSVSVSFSFRLHTLLSYPCSPSFSRRIFCVACIRYFVIRQPRGFAPNWFSPCQINSFFNKPSCVFTQPSSWGNNNKSFREQHTACSECAIPHNATKRQKKPTTNREHSWQIKLRRWRATRSVR